MEKNRATNIMTAPAAACLPIVLKEFIQPLQKHNTWEITGCTVYSDTKMVREMNITVFECEVN